MFVPIRFEMSKHSIRSGSDVEPERRLQPVERLDALLAAALGLQALLVEREPRVALGQLEDAALVAALGRAHLDRRRRGARRAPAAERLALVLVDLALDDDLRRDRRAGRRSTGATNSSATSADRRARRRSRGRTTGGRRARRRAPGRPARWRRSRRRRRAIASSVPTASLATRWRSSSERTARRRLRSRAACSYSCASAAAAIRASSVALDLAVAAGEEGDRRRRSPRGTPPS